MSIPPALVTLINKTDPNFLGFAYALAIAPGPPPHTIFLPLRISAHLDFKTFRVERLIRTNKDNNNPRGTWTTLSTHGHEVPGKMLKTAFDHLFAAQHDFVDKLNNRMQRTAKLVRP